MSLNQNKLVFLFGFLIYFELLAMKQIITYKTIKLIRDDEIKTIEFIADDKNLKEIEHYINSMTLIAEYTESERPDFIILNKLNSEFALTKDLFNYTREIIFHQLKSFGVKKLLLVVKEIYYEKIYREIESIEPFMKGFKTAEDAYIWINENRHLIA